MDCPNNMKPKKEKTIEICRSFSQKVSNPKNRYENMDFFASAKAEVGEADKEKVSEELYAFVQDEVTKSVRAYELENIPAPVPMKLTAKEEAEARRKGEEAILGDLEEEAIKEEEKEKESLTNIPPEEVGGVEEKIKEEEKKVEEDLTIIEE